MAEPIRIKIFVTKRGNRVPFHDSLGHYRNALPDDVSGPAYDVVEMVEAAPMREEFRRVFQDALDDNFGPHETLSVDECVTTMGHEVRHLKDELEKWRARAEMLDKALREIVGYREANSTITKLGPVLYPDYEDFESLEAIAKEALKP